MLSLIHFYFKTQPYEPFHEKTFISVLQVVLNKSATSKMNVPVITIPK